MLIADGEPDLSDDVIDIEGLVSLPAQVPVVLDFSDFLEDRLGYASLSVEGNKIYADITLLDNDKANAKKQIPMYPAIYGHILDAEMQGDLKLIKKFSIKGVSFSFNKNSDARIEKV